MHVFYFETFKSYWFVREKEKEKKRKRRRKEKKEKKKRKTTNKRKKKKKKDDFIYVRRNWQTAGEPPNANQTKR